MRTFLGLSMVASALAVTPTMFTEADSGVCNWEGLVNHDAVVDFCACKGMRLATYADVCPNGEGSYVLGALHGGDQWAAFYDPSLPNDYVQVGNTPNHFNCRKHSTLGSTPSWGTDESRGSYESNYVYCVANTDAPGGAAPSVFNEHNVAPSLHAVDACAALATSGDFANAAAFCACKKMRLATYDEICPGGSFVNPTYGVYSGNSWAAYWDPTYGNTWVQVGGGSSHPVCRKHIGLGTFPDLPSWGTDGSKSGWESNQMFCMPEGPSVVVPTLYTAANGGSCDFAGVHSHTKAEEFCQCSGHSGLAEYKDICPDGAFYQGSTFSGDQWAAFADPLLDNTWTQVGVRSGASNNCMKHRELGAEAAWGVDGSVTKGPYESNYIFCAGQITVAPTNAPTGTPTVVPTDAPTNAPTVVPTDAPTNAPTVVPTDAPTQSPTVGPTNAPTLDPTNAPTDAPTMYTASQLDAMHFHEWQVGIFGDDVYKCNDELGCSINVRGKRHMWKAVELSPSRANFVSAHEFISGTTSDGEWKGDGGSTLVFVSAKEKRTFQFECVSSCRD